MHIKYSPYQALIDKSDIARNHLWQRQYYEASSLYDDIITTYFRELRINHKDVNWYAWEGIYFFNWIRKSVSSDIELNRYQSALRTIEWYITLKKDMIENYLIHDNNTIYSATSVNRLEDDIVNAIFIKAKILIHINKNEEAIGEANRAYNILLKSSRNDSPRDASNIESSITDIYLLNSLIYKDEGNYEMALENLRLFTSRRTKDDRFLEYDIATFTNEILKINDYISFTFSHSWSIYDNFSKIIKFDGVLTNYGRILIGLDQRQEAIRLMNSMGTPPLWDRSNLNFEIKNYKECFEDLNFLIYKNREDGRDTFAAAYTLRARCRALLGDWHGAEIDLKKSLEIEPKDATVNLLLGFVLLELNNLNEACKNIRIAAEMNVSDAMTILTDNCR